jgi:hypothetical protein
VESHPLLFSEASPSFISCEFHKKKVEELQWVEILIPVNQFLFLDNLAKPICKINII